MHLGQDQQQNPTVHSGGVSRGSADWIQGYMYNLYSTFGGVSVTVADGGLSLRVGHMSQVLSPQT